MRDHQLPPHTQNWRISDIFKLEGWGTGQKTENPAAGLRGKHSRLLLLLTEALHNDHGFGMGHYGHVAQRQSQALTRWRKPHQIH